MTTEHRLNSSHITVSGIRVQIERKDIKNLHLGVYPPNGRVRVAVPLVVSDDAVRLAVVGKLGWISTCQIGNSRGISCLSNPWPMKRGELNTEP